MSMNFQEKTMSYPDRFRESFQKNESRKNPFKENPIELELMKSKTKFLNRENQIKKQDIPDKSKHLRTIDEKPKRQSMSGSLGSIPSHNPKFEIFDTHTLVAKVNLPTSTKSSKSTLTKSRSNNLFQSHQPVITLKPHYNNSTGMMNSSDINLKLTRHSNSNLEEKRSMSAVVKSQTRMEQPFNKSVTIKPSNQLINSKSQNRISSATNKSNTNGNNNNNYQIYDSLNRSRNKAVTKGADQNYDPSAIYLSLPRKPKNQAHSQNEVKPSGRTKPIGTPIDSLRKHKISLEATTTIATDSSDANPINFSSTLAKAATNSPPIKRRSSSLIHSPNPRMPARFASRSTINDIYTNKNYQEYQEKYKKAANEILRENLAIKFGPNSSFLNQTNHEDVASRSSISSTSSSTSSGTDQQISISSIPHDDIPLGIPKNNEIISPSKDLHEDSHKISPNAQNSNKVDTTSEIMQGTVTFDGNQKEDVNLVHISDEDNDEYEEYDLDDDHSTSESYTSGSGEDIENLKKKFIPLYEIERLDDDFVLQNDMTGLPDHQHSQSFRVENTSVASNTEVFVHKESLQRAKNALLIEPNQGILSVKLSAMISENHKVKKRRAIFDPHVLLLDACLEPDFELVKELVPKVQNISKKTIDGITALHNAVCSADPKLVLFLLQSGADVNASDADGWTPLHCAACCNNKQISKILVEHGASLFSQTLSDFEIPSQKCNKASQEDTQCEEYLFCNLPILYLNNRIFIYPYIGEQENLGVSNGGIAYALFSYNPQMEDELPLVPNQILKILNTNPPGESGWFQAEDLSQIVNSPRRGFVAAAYVSIYPLIMPQKRTDLIYRS